MAAFLVDFPLGMIRANVTVIARFWLASLFEAELVAQMAILALADRAIFVRATDVVAIFAGRTGDCLAFNAERCASAGTVSRLQFREWKGTFHAWILFCTNV